MEFRHLEYFVEASRHRSITEAARALHISQQALSRCLAGLENELGCALFTRSSRGTKLTKEGKYLLEAFEPEILRFQSLCVEYRDHFANKPQALQFCCAPGVLRCLDPDLLFRFQETHPAIVPEALEMADPECDKYVVTDASHFGLLAILENRHGQRFPFTMVRTLPLHLFVSRANPLSTRERVRFFDLRTQPFLVLGGGFYYLRMIREEARRAGFEPSIAYMSVDADHLIQLAARNRGVLLCVEPLYDAGRHPDLAIVPFDNPSLTWSVAFIYRNWEKLRPAARQFVQFVVEQASGGNGFGLMRFSQAT